MGFSGVAFGLPFAMNSVEGTEASLFVAAAASRSSWRRAVVAVGAAALTLLPVGGLIWVLFHFVGATYLDYAIAAIVFVLGARELREGLSERSEGAPEGDAGASEPAIGLAPASAASVCEFQRSHGIDPTGVIDERTRAAVRAARVEAGAPSVDAYLLGTDVADAAAVADFQRRHGLRATGDVDASTRGALRVAQQQGFVDPLDPACVRRFQSDHGLAPTGDVDETTAIAIATVRGEGGTAVDDEPRQVRIDAASALRRLDVTDAASVERLQRALGLRPDGSVGTETRGAILALRARMHPDPADPASIKAAQTEIDVPVTGTIDAPTRAAAGRTLESALRPPTSGLLPDPADAEAVRALQGRYQLDRSGAVDERTRQAARHARDFECDIDPADDATIRRFQRDHGLAPDGVIGERTQAAVAVVRAERVASEPRDRRHRYGPFDQPGIPVLPLDLADPATVRTFQSAHHLPPDGVIDEKTRTALTVAMRERVDGGPLQGSHDPAPSQGGPIGWLRDTLGDAWPAYVGVILETSEALLYTFAVASSSFSLVPAVIGAGAGFVWPWATLPLVRRVTERLPEWKQEATIGAILVAVAATFGVLHAIGVFKG